MQTRLNMTHTKRLLGKTVPPSFGLIRGLLLLFWALGLQTLMSDAARAAPVQILFWDQSPPATGTEIDRWLAAFHKRNPGIQVLRQHFETDELQRRFLRSPLTGDGADIVVASSEAAGLFAEAGVIQPVDELFTSSIYAARSLDLTRKDGRIWGVPLHEGHHLLLYYNKGLVENPPADTHELMEKAEAFANPRQGRYGLSFAQDDPRLLLSLLHAFGGTPLKQNERKIKVTIDTPEMQAALQFLVDLRAKNKIPPKSCQRDCAQAMFLRGDVPFYIGSDGEAGLADNPGSSFGIAPLPVLTETGRPLPSVLDGVAVYVNASAKGRELQAIKTLIQFLASNQVQQRVITRLNRIPVTLAARSSPALKNQAFLHASLEATRHALPVPPQVEMRAAWDAMRIMLQKSLADGEKVKDAIKKGRKAADEALKDIRPPEKKPETTASASSSSLHKCNL